MKIIFKISTVLVLLTISAAANGGKVFKDYCWGCHHQTSVAFGPSFEQIANMRTVGEIQGHIVSPQSMYEQLGHKRSVMPAFGDTLSQKELDDITKFILTFKGKN
ncbi:MAG: cytochrome c [Campylobacterota bacterium]|nr:cytochrome c [Campylobacterota bacterium]